MGGHLTYDVAGADVPALGVRLRDFGRRWLRLAGNRTLQEVMIRGQRSSQLFSAN